MQLIIMSDSCAHTRTFSIRRVHWVLLATLAILLSLAMILAGGVLALRYVDRWMAMPMVEGVLGNVLLVDREVGSEASTPVDMMAARLAEMRVQVVRLEAISARLLKMSGVSDPMLSNQPVGQGGLKASEDRSVSVHELKGVFKEIASKIDRQSDVLNILDADMQLTRSRFQRIPNALPLTDVIPVSNFGPRIDPFSGRRAQHEGIDFVAPLGTPIFAAAAGVVTKAAYHVGYGNMVEIEHDPQTSTRYGHASKLLVKQGDVVRLGQPIALVGTTGRSTGAHLHFEVRVEGVAKNPVSFFAKQNLPLVSPGAVAALNGILADNALKPLD